MLVDIQHIVEIIATHVQHRFVKAKGGSTNTTRVAIHLNSIVPSYLLYVKRPEHS